jgi:hypothetical protein
LTDFSEVAMPRLVHQLPKYQKHRASGQAVVTLNGQDIYLGPHGTAISKRAYDRGNRDTLCGVRTASMSEAADRQQLMPPGDCAPAKITHYTQGHFPASPQPKEHAPR